MNNLLQSASSIRESKNVNAGNGIRKRLLVIVAFIGLMFISGSVMAGGASSLGFLGVGVAHVILMYVFHSLFQ